MKKLLLPVCLLALAACEPTTSGTSGPGGSPREARDGACNADTFRTLVGQSSSVLRSVQLPPGTRVIFPGMPVTMDFNEARLNFDIGGDGMITRVWCG